jgi:hypothetical protein
MVYISFWKQQQASPLTIIFSTKFYITHLMWPVARVSQAMCPKLVTFRESFAALAAQMMTRTADFFHHRHVQGRKLGFIPPNCQLYWQI